MPRLTNTKTPRLTLSPFKTLVVYVDDVVITKSDSKGILSLKSLFHDQFHIKDLGTLQYILGVKRPTLLKAQACRI